MVNSLYKISLNLFIIITILSFSVVKDFFPAIYYMKYFFMFLLCLILLIKKRSFIEIKYFHIWMYLFFSINFILSLVISQKFSFIAFFDYINLMQMLTYILLIFPNLGQQEIKKWIKTLIFWGLGLVTAPSLILAQSQTYYYTQETRLRFISYFDNPNELAQFCMALNIIIIIVILLNDKNRIKLIPLFLLAANVFIIKLTDSRAALISMLFFFVAFAYLYFILRRPNKYIFNFLAFLSFIVLVLISFSYYDITYDYISFLSSRRIDIWKDMLTEQGFYNYLFGGIIDETTLFGSTVTTNAYIDIIGETGIIGLILWLVVVFKVFKEGLILSSYKIRVFKFTILISYLFYYIFESGLNSMGNISSFIFWFLISIQFFDYDKITKISTQGYLNFLENDFSG